MDTNFERKAKVFKIVENASATIKDSVLRDFDRMTFKSDEDFNEYLAETSALVDYKEEKRHQVPKSSVVDANGPVDLSKVSEATRSWLEAKKSDYKDPLGGKTGSENPYQV